MWFEDWSRVGVLLGIGVVAYAWLVLVVRVSGKRTLTKLNAFDFLVTIALGSTLSTVVLSRDSPLAEGLAALALLAGLQVAISLASRWRAFGRLVRSRPRALVNRGVVDHDALTHERLTEAELLQIARQNGHGSVEAVDLMILESDGTVSVITDRGNGSALANVRGARP